MFKPLFINFLLLSVLVSCSTFEQSTTQVASEDQIKEKVKAYEEASKAVSTSLEQVVIQARTKGDEVVKFVSSDLFLKATDASLSGDSLSSSLILKYVVDLNPNDIYLRKRYAVELIKSNQLELGEKELLYLVKNGDHDIKAKAKLLLAGVYSALGEDDKAKNYYLSLVYKTKPIIAESCIYLSKLYVEENNLKKANGTLNYCSNKDAGNKSIYTFHKGKIYFDKSDYQTAKKFFKKSIKLDATNQQSVILLGMIYEQEGSFLAAKKLYKKFLEIDGNNYTALGKYVNLLFADGEYYEVVPYLEKLLALDPENLNLKVRLGVIYTETEKIEDAKGIFKEILDEIPDSDKVLYYLGSLYQKTNDGDEAVEFYSRIHEESTLFHESSIQIANILNRYAQRNPRYEKKFFEFLNRDEKFSKALKFELDVILAGYLENKKQLSKAISLIESHKDNEGYTDGHAYYLASLYDKDKSFEKAEEIMLMLLKKDPNNSHALNFLGYTYLEKGVHLDKAYKYIKKAVELNPKDGYIRDSLGWYYYKMGDYKNAYKEIKKAFSLVSNDVVIAKHLGLIYTSLEKPEKAREYYVEALKNCTQTKEREEILNYLDQLDTVRLPASR